MKLTASWVRIAQWIMPVVLLAWMLVGRALFGTSGWLAVVLVYYSIFILPVLYVLPVLTLFDREAKADSSVRSGYVIANYVMWGAIFICGFALPDAGDSPGVIPSALMRLGMSEAVSVGIASGTFWVFVAGWLVAAFFAVRGIMASKANGAAG